MEKINANDFPNKYQLITSLSTCEPSHPTKCRFCGETSTEFFKKKSHIIPELLGRNNFISNSECDKCNTYFQQFESHLAILARPYLAFTNIKTKKNTPKFQSRNNSENQERTTIKVDHKSLKRIVNINKDDIKIDKENLKIELTLRNPKFKPIYVYRALSKIILGIMSDQIAEDNQDFFEWILDKKSLSEVPHGFMTKLTKKYFITPKAMLFQAKELVIGEIEYPEFIGIVCFANVVIQFYLPISKRLETLHSEKRVMALTIYPAIFYDGLPEEIAKGKMKYNLTHMNLTQKEAYEFNDKLTFKARPGSTFNI